MWILMHNCGCGGPALKRPTKPLASDPISDDDVFRLDGTKFVPGDPVVCGTCGKGMRLMDLHPDNFVEEVPAMVAVKISRLKDEALDYAVGVARGLQVGIANRYSLSWNLTGELIEEMRMTFATFGTGPAINGKLHIYPIIAIPGIRGKYHASEGPTHLIAACRCYVLAKMSMDADGEVMIPAALVTQ
jgi:hypothetical protein